MLDGHLDIYIPAPVRPAGAQPRETCDRHLDLPPRALWSWGGIAGIATAQAATIVVGCRAAGDLFAGLHDSSECLTTLAGCLGILACLDLARRVACEMAAQASRRAGLLTHTSSSAAMCSRVRHGLAPAVASAILATGLLMAMAVLNLPLALLMALPFLAILSRPLRAFRPVRRYRLLRMAGASGLVRAAATLGAYGWLLLVSWIIYTLLSGAPLQGTDVTVLMASLAALGCVLADLRQASCHLRSDWR